MFCALLTSRYQVSVYRTNGPLVMKIGQKLTFSYHQISSNVHLISFSDYSVPFQFNLELK